MNIVERLRKKMSYANCGKQSRALFREAAITIDGLAEALIDARDNGLIYWEPNTERGHVQKALMVARIDKLLASQP